MKSARRRRERLLVTAICTRAEISASTFRLFSAAMIPGESSATNAAVSSRYSLRLSHFSIVFSASRLLVSQARRRNDHTSSRASIQTTTYRSGPPCDLLTAAAMSRHLRAALGRLLSSACLARARAMVSATSPCSVMRFRAARATSWSIAMSDYGAHGDRFANKKPTATAARLQLLRGRSKTA